MNKEDTHKVLQSISFVLFVLAVFLVVLTIGAFKNLRSVNPAYNSISVTGEGESFSVPDIASFSFTVSADAKVVSDAQAEVTRKMDAILAGLKALGIEEKDIKTTDYSVWPKYVYTTTVCVPNRDCQPSRQIPDGYTANHSVSVKVRNTENAGKALALVGDNGATGLSGISFTIDAPDKIMEEARAEAIADAREKAEALSKELGVRLVRVVGFYDNTGGPIPYYAEGLGGDMMKSAMAPAPTIPIGENKTRASVTITYEIR